MKPLLIEVAPESYIRQVRVRFSVSSEHRGKVGPTVELVTGSGGGDCGYKFEADRTYLVYADIDKKGVLTTGVCSPTKLLENAAEDLEFIGGLSSARSAGSVFGEVTQYRLMPSTSASQPNSPLGSVRITLDGDKGSSATMTDQSGKFRFGDLVPGEYQIKVFAPDGLLPALSNERVRIPEKGCAVRDFILRAETS